MSVKLIAVDLDGTLLSEKKELKERTSKALYLAAEKGVHIVPSTGRIRSAIPNAVSELPFIKYMITVNGAMVWDLKKKEIIYRSTISSEDALKIWDYIQRYDAFCDIYADDRGLMEANTRPKVEEYAINPEIIKLILSSREIISDIREYIVKSHCNVDKINMYFNDLKIQEEAKAAVKSFPNVSVTTSLVNNIEINHKNANKGEALARLCEYLGVSLEEAMTFGDGDNDMSMILRAGTGIAMGNAVNEIKEAADYIAPTNEEEGVADTIERLVLSK